VRALMLALLLAGCGEAANLQVDWSGAPLQISPSLLGHNTVWSRGGLGLWNEQTQAVDPPLLDDVRALAPGALRYPGGTRAMRWHFDGAIGATRQPQCDAFSGMLDGTRYGLDEFLGVARSLSAQVSLVAPWVDGTPEETAAMVAYANGSTGTSVPIGTDGNGKDWGDARDWAQKRSGPANGVRWLEIGNEPYLSLPTGPMVSCGRPSQFTQSERWVAGQRIPTTAVDYADQVAKTGALVRAIDPSLRIGVAAADSDDGLGDVDRTQGNATPWNATLVARAPDAFDFFVLHPYDFTVDDDARLGLADRLQMEVHSLRALAPDKQVGVTEFGFLFGGSNQLNAIVTADVLRVAVEEQLELSLRHILIEDDPHEPFADSALILGATRSPAYRMLTVLAPALAGLSAVPVKSTPPGLTALAARDPGHVVLLVIDRRPIALAPTEVTAALPDGSFSGTASVLAAPDLDGKGDDVTRSDEPVSATGTLRLTLPPDGVAVIVLTRL
jgi:hypothetical protein